MNKGLSEEAAFAEVNKKTAWQRFKDPGNLGWSPGSMQELRAKINRSNHWASIGDALGKVAPAVTAPVGQAVSMHDTAAAGQAKVDADRDKGLQGLNEKEQAIRDDQSRAASQQMRDVQREMNELYGKIATAVRW